MLLGQVLELVVVEVAAESHGGQHKDLPGGQARTTPIGPTGPIDIRGDGLEQVIAELGSAGDVLQGGEPGDDLVAAGGVEPDVEDGCGAELKLRIEGDAHGADP